MGSNPRLIIPGPLPGLNEYISAERTNRHIAAKMKRQVEHDIIMLARADLRGVKLKGPIRMRYTWVERNKRRDLDNIAFARKFIQDALVKAGVLENDGWNHICGFEDAFAVDKLRPRVEVEFLRGEDV